MFLSMLNVSEKPTKEEVMKSFEVPVGAVKEKLEQLKKKQEAAEARSHKPSINQQKQQPKSAFANDDEAITDSEDISDDESAS